MRDPSMSPSSTTELERFSERVVAAKLETIGPTEHELRWSAFDQSGSSRTIGLRSGVTLSLSRVRWERAWTLGFTPEASKLKFIVARGPGPRVVAGGRGVHHLSGGTATVSRFCAPTELRFEFADATSAQEHQELCLEIDRERLCELMGQPVLPVAIERIWSSAEDYPFEVLAAPPSAFRVLDDLMDCDARGPGRQLRLEGLGLELLGAWLDHIEEERGGRQSAVDVERFEQARRILLDRMLEPPSLPELARLTGLNEAKLKAGFRAQFGDTVYGYLRKQRMNQALHLLRQGGSSVTEVATRVGYSNPSKFAAAFRAQFGLSPSGVR